MELRVGSSPVFVPMMTLVRVVRVVRIRVIRAVRAVRAVRIRVIRRSERSEPSESELDLGRVFGASVRLACTVCTCQTMVVSVQVPAGLWQRRVLRLRCGLQGYSIVRLLGAPWAAVMS
jgi:hypothetical protein